MSAGESWMTTGGTRVEIIEVLDSRVRIYYPVSRGIDIAKKERLVCLWADRTKR